MQMLLGALCTWSHALGLILLLLLGTSAIQVQFKITSLDCCEKSIQIPKLYKQSKHQNMETRLQIVS